MSQHSTATRRMFLKGGALVVGPIAAASISTLALAQDRSDVTSSSRLRRLEDEAAIRAVHESWLRQINAGEGLVLSETFRRVTADHAGLADRIEIAADGRSATGHFDCVVDLEITLSQDSTLAQMAHAQGSGLVCTTERRRVTVEYLKVADAWRIEKVASRAG